MTKRKKKKQHWYTTVGAGVLVILGVLLIAGVLLARPAAFPSAQKYGVTFSQPHASGIGLNWQEVYHAILTDLDVKHLRLVAYWNVIEPEEGVFDFTTLDYQMDQAAAHGAQVILAVGRKVPRWPECHIPQWAQELEEKQQQEVVLTMVSEVVARYKDHPALRMWQLENEPLLDFGICPPADAVFLQQEQQLIRDLDPNHPILITDSGELNWWIDASRYGDVVGTTMYRTVFSDKTQKLFHYDYIFPSWMYRLKSRYVGLLRNKDVLIVELQGEPWGTVPFTQMSIQDREASFSPARFEELLRFASRTQLPEAYWWGVEYWYWEKENQGRDQYWEMAKRIFEPVT
ncbi:MAG: beta-galactosidase [Candidatus Andersenbacteria bacterium]